MATTSPLKNLILSTLGSQELTLDQCHAQLATATDEEITRPRLMQLIRSMLGRGMLVRATEATATGTVRRYSIPRDAYCAEPAVGDGDASWLVIKYAPGIFAGKILGSEFTEADARTCAAALNARDRQVLGLQSRQGGKVVL